MAHRLPAAQPLEFYRQDDEAHHYARYVRGRGKRDYAGHNGQFLPVAKPWDVLVVAGLDRDRYKHSCWFYSTEHFDRYSSRTCSHYWCATGLFLARVVLP